MSVHWVFILKGVSCGDHLSTRCVCCHPALRNGLLGFAIKRTDLNPETNEVLRLDWLGGYKRFKETDNGKSEDVRSLEAPFQRFRWNDYTLNPARKYM